MRPKGKLYLLPLKICIRAKLYHLSFLFFFLYIYKTKIFTCCRYYVYMLLSVKEYW